MRSSRRVLTVAAVAVVAALTVGPARAGATGSLSFAAPITLSGAPNQTVGVGGEPSLQDDGRGHVYVTSPTGLATATVNQLGVITINEATGGGALWRSLDGGNTFANPTSPIFFGTQNGGGDTDVTADTAGTVYTADLEAAATDIQHDPSQHGAALSSPAQNGPSNDREWLTPVGNKIFLTYHEFNTNFDFIYVSTDGGTTFIPTGTAGKIIDPSDNSNAAADCINGNLLSKPVTDSLGGLYVLLNCSNAPNNAKPTGSPLDRLYVAISRDGGHHFHTTLVSDLSNNNVNPGTWGHVFNQLGIDAAGNLFIAASGQLTGTDTVQTFVIRSLDNGASWDPTPINLNAGLPNSAVFPAIALGQAGQVAVGYYQVTQCQTGSTTCKLSDYRADGDIFQYFIAQSFNATAVTPIFTKTQVTTASPHQNGICTDGLFCGTPLSAGGNRNLADFESMAVDPTGHIELIIPADPGNVAAGDSSHPTVNWFFKQNSGALMVPGATNGNGTGNQTYVFPAANVAEVPLVAGFALAGGAILTFAIRGSRRRNRREIA